MTGVLSSDQCPRTNIPKVKEFDASPVGLAAFATGLRVHVCLEPFERVIGLCVTGKMSLSFLPTAVAILMGNYVLSVGQVWLRQTGQRIDAMVSPKRSSILSSQGVK